MSLALRGSAASAAALLLLASCGGRDANPVAMTQPTDHLLNCNLMLAEYRANEERGHSLLREKSDAESDNVALAVTGALLFWPALFFMDFSDTEKVELDALRARNTYLATRMSGQECTEAPVPAAASARDWPPEKQVKVREGEEGGPPPKCTDVGGYEEYKKRTGEICML